MKHTGVGGGCKCLQGPRLIFALPDREEVGVLDGDGEVRLLLRLAMRHLVFVNSRSAPLQL